MTNPFTLLDINNLTRAYKNSSIANDCLPRFLNSYTFDSVYETEDDSLVFSAGGENEIDIEFFNFNHPIKRTMQIMYWENGKPVMLYF